MRSGGAQPVLLVGRGDVIGGSLLVFCSGWLEGWGVHCTVREGERENREGKREGERVIEAERRREGERGRENQCAI